MSKHQADVASSGKQGRLLRRGNELLKIAAEEWANVLLTLESWGWQPKPGERIRLLATGVEVSAEQTRELAAAGRALMDAALKNPLAVYPIPAEMGTVYEVTAFCDNGGFTIYEGQSPADKR